MLITLLDSQIKQLPLIFLCFLTVSVVDLVSLAMFIPIISLILSGDFSVFTGDSWFLGVLSNLIEDISIRNLAIILFAVFLLKSVMSVFIHWVIISYINTQRVMLGSKIFSRYLQGGFKFGIQKREADQIYNLQTLTTHYTMAIQSTLKFSNDSLIALGVLSVLVFMNPIAFAVTAGTLTVIVLGYLLVFRKIVTDLGRKLNDNMSDALRISNEGIRGVNEIHFLKKKSYFIKNYISALLNVKKASIGIEIHGIMPRVLVEMSIISILSFALLLISFNIINLDGLALVFGVYAVAVVRLVPIISSLASQITRFRSVQNSVERLYNDVVQSSENTENEESLIEQEGSEEQFDSLVFKDVSFQYDASHKVIQNLSLSIKRGDIVGIYGPSGSGKSTFLRLVLGLLAPTDGQILLNDRKTPDQIQPESLSFGYIPQDAVMMNRSVLENVTLDNDASDKTREKVNALLDKACLGEVVSSLQNGLEEQVGDFGARFSAGQKQRLAFARVLAHDKSFFILDEATNALDMKTEKMLMDGLIKGGVIETALIVSHRPSTLADCDFIISFSEDGIQIIDELKDTNTDDHHNQDNA